MEPIDDDAEEMYEIDPRRTGGRIGEIVRTVEYNEVSV